MEEVVADPGRCFLPPSFLHLVSRTSLALAGVHIGAGLRPQNGALKLSEPCVPLSLVKSWAG